MQQETLEKLRRMNFGGVADHIESLESARQTMMADNRRHLREIETIKRNLATYIQDYGTLNAEYKERVAYWEKRARAAEKELEEVEDLCRRRGEAMQEFCARVEAHEIRSKYTYGKFKALLAPDPKSGE